MSRAAPLRDPRIAKKEMIITRFKSAQQRRQREREQGKPQTQNVTKLQQTISKSPQTISKSPQTTKSTQNIKIQATATKVTDSEKSPLPKQRLTKKAKAQKSPIKTKEKRMEVKSPILIEDDSPEFYPEKMKRTPGIRKEFLKPKQKSTMIARTNKRKFNTPKRGISSSSNQAFPSNSELASKCKSPVYSELSMAEVIRIVEENDSLDDEDLMEILTCPSPVWWEEPPDEMYIEEAICSRKPVENNSEKTKSPIRERCLNTLRNSAKYVNKIKTKKSNPETTTLNNITAKRTDIKDDKFIKKSKKLENVLGNIKNKATKDSDLASEPIKQEILNKASLQTNSVEKPIDITCISDTNVVIDTTEDITANDKDEQVYEMVQDVNKTTNQGKTKKLSESTEDSMDDFNCENQELLLDLENMNIPIGGNIEMDSPDCVIINDDNSSKVIDIDSLDDNNVNEQKTDNHDIIIKEDNEKCSNINTEINSDNNISNKNTKEHESKENHSELTNNVDDEQTLVPKNMPPLIKYPKFENTVFPSPNSYKSISDDVTESSSISGIDMMDTISDTNFKFITDDDIDDVSDGDNKNKNNDEALVDDEGANSKEESNKSDSIKKDNKNIELDEMAILTNTNDLKSKDAYITVYKIVPNDDTNQKSNNKFKNIPEYSSYVENLIQSENKMETEDLDGEIPDIPIDSKGQLNSFFKKCKNAYRKRKRVETQDKVDIETNECRSKKSITVAQEENVKYCLKCSSIFDTDDCSYCLKTEKDADKTESFTCDKCDFVGESTNNVNTHLQEHNTNEEEAKT